MVERVVLLVERNPGDHCHAGGQLHQREETLARHLYHRYVVGIVVLPGNHVHRGD